MEKLINITLKVWRQRGPQEKGAFETYQLENISTESSFLEMLDVLNEKLAKRTAMIKVKRAAKPI